MTFNATINAGEFAKAASMAARVSPRATQTPHPILMNVKLSAAAYGGLLVEGTDMDRRIAITVAGKASGEITVSAERLAAVTATLDPLGDATLELADRMLMLKQGRARMKLATLAATDFPPQPMRETATALTCPSPSLIEAITAVQGAAETDGLRAYLNGVHVDGSGREPMLVASDGKVLAVAPLAFADESKPPSAIIPMSAIGNIIAVAGLGELTTLQISRSSCSVSAGNVLFETKLVEYAAVDWRRLVRRASKSRFTVAVADLDRAIRRTVAADLRTLVFAFGETVQTEGRAVNGDSPNEAVDAFPAIEAIGDDVTVGVATQFARWAVQSFKGAETLEFSLQDGAMSMEIRNPKGDHNDVRVIMPVRL